MRGSEKHVLCPALKFEIPPNKLEYVDFMLPFELLFYDIKSSSSIKKILDITFSSLDNFNKNTIKNNLSKEELKTLHNLRKQKHLIIQKATLLLSPRKMLTSVK